MTSGKQIKITGLLCIIVALAFSIFKLATNYNSIIGNFTGKPENLTVSPHNFLLENKGTKSSGPIIYAYHAEPVRGTINYSLEALKVGMNVDCKLVKNICYNLPHKPYDYVSNSTRSSIIQYVVWLVMGVAMILFSDRFVDNKGTRDDGV